MTTPAGPGPRAPGIPREWLRSLALAMILTTIEYRVLLLVIGMPRPVSTRWLSKRLGLDYANVKRAVRSLVAWNIVKRAPEGLVFQPDFRLWRREGVEIDPPASSALTSERPVTTPSSPQLTPKCL